MTTYSMTKRAGTVLAAVFFLIAAVPAVPAAQAAGRSAEGQQIAARWCAACHVVASDQVSANSDAPSFASIGSTLKTDADKNALQLFLADPHPVMPNMNLTRQEVADLVAYIASLRGDTD